MTIPYERTRALVSTKEFLQSLLNPKLTPRIPRAIRGQAKALLRHYPCLVEIELAHKALPEWFGPVPPFSHAPGRTAFTELGIGAATDAESCEQAAAETIPATGGSEGQGVGVFSGLDYGQIDFVCKVDKPNQQAVADYLRRGVEVAIVPNTEVSEAPPFALDVVENPSFWIGCFDTEAQARDAALKLGLVVR